jgi:DNA-binding winged helix-turn-helix (wHTH) protein
MQFRWAEFRLDPDARSLERDGERVRVQDLAFDLLALLLHHHGRVVSDAFLRQRLWPAVVVSDSSLRQVLKEARRAIGDDGRTQRQIETVRGHGLRFVEAVAVSGATQRFVGRADLVQTLDDMVAASASGSGGIALLSGSAGIGKTALLTEIAARAEARGLRVLRGWAHAGAESDAYALWMEVAEALGVNGLAVRDELPASGGISESRRFDRFRELQRALLAAARAQPLLVALDDLQFADRESLAVLRFLAPALRTARACVVATHRVLAPGHAGTSDLAALSADASTRVVELHGLPANELQTLVRSRLGAALADDAAAILAARTEGSPLLALEVMRALAADGAPAPQPSVERIDASAVLGVVPLVRRRLAAYGDSTRRALYAAAVSGEPFDLELACLLADCTRAQLDIALRECEHSGVVECFGPEAWSFSHPLFAEAVAEDLAGRGETTVATLHARALGALESQATRDLFRLANHAFRARRVLPSRVVVEHLRSAARAAWKMHAVADAEAWQERAVAAAADAALAPLELCDLLTELGELTTASSGIASARPHFDRAARLASAHGDRRRLALAALGYAHRTFALDAIDGVIAWLRAADAAPCGDLGLEARIRVRLGTELATSERGGDPEDEQRVRDGVAAARSLGDPLTLGRVLADSSIAFFSADDSRAALALAEEVSACGRHAGDVEIEFRGLAETATVQLEAGTRDGFDAALGACQRFVARAPIPYALGVTHGIHALQCLLDGKLDAARRAMADAERYARATGSLGLGLIAGLQFFLLARESGQLDLVLPILARGRARFPHLTGLSAVGGLAAGLCGDVGAAREAAEGTLRGLPRLPRNRARLATLAVAAELSWVAREATLAAALEPELAPHAARHGVVGNAATYWGSLEHALGFVTLAQGRRSEAAQHFERALRAHEALGAPAFSRRSLEMAEEARRARRGSVRLVS